MFKTFLGKVLFSKIIILFSLLLSLTTSLFSYNFEVESFEDLTFSSKENDITITDVNGDIAGLIVIQTVEKEISFSSNLGVVESENTINGYKLFLSPDEKAIKIKKTGFIPFDYELPLRIKSNCNYFLVLGTDKDKLSSVTFDSKYPVDIYSNKNKKLGTTPFIHKDISLGKRTYTFKSRDKIIYKKEIDVLPFDRLYQIRVAKLNLIHSFEKKYFKNIQTGEVFTLDDSMVKTIENEIICPIGEISITIIHKNELIKKETMSLSFNDKMDIAFTSSDDKVLDKKFKIIIKSLLTNEIVNYDLDFNLKTVKYQDLEIISDPSNAIVSLDGIEVGETPFKISQIEVRDYDLKIEKKPWKTLLTTIKVKQDSIKKVSYKLGAGKEFASIKFKYDKESRFALENRIKIFLNDTLIPKRINNEILLISGEYDLKITHPMFKDEFYDLDLKESEFKVINLSDDMRNLKQGRGFWNTNKWYSFFTFSISIGASAYLNFIADEYYDDFKRSTSSSLAKKNYDNAILFDDYRNYSAGISIIPLYWYLHSWIMESSYKKKGIKNNE